MNLSPRFTGAWLLALLACPAPSEAQSDVAFPPEVYAERRNALVDALGAPVVVPGEYMIRHGGALKQDLDFFYLTGVESPYAIAVLVPAAGGGAETTLFLPEPFQFAGAQYSWADPRQRHAAWNRTIRRLSPGTAAEEATGVEATASLDAFAERLPALVSGSRAVYFVRDGAHLYAPPGLEPPRSVRQQLEASMATQLPGIEIRDAAPAIHRMRLVKDEREIAALRRAAQISADGLVEAMKRIAPGVNDLEVAGVMEAEWKRQGSPRASFSPIVASGVSAVSLYTLRSENYNAVDRVMRDGEMVFIDYGAAEWAMYASDVCRTFPVSGRFTPEQRRLYEIVIEAQDSAFARIRPGVMMEDVIRAAAGVYQSHGLQEHEDIERLGVERIWGLMPSPTHWITRNGGLTDYSGARGTGVRDLGHHVGLDATDSRDYTRPLEPGMVFTVEPKIYVPEMELAIMVEDVILVTEDGYENLSRSAPRTVEAIERVMGAARR